MDKKIDLEIQYTVDDYVRGFTFIQNRQFIVRYAILILFFIPVIFMLFIFFMNPDSVNQMSLKNTLITFAPILAICGLLLLLKFFPNPVLKWNLRRQFKSSPLLQAIQKISFDEIGINGKTNLSAGETKWQAIIEATETDDDFFFFTSSKFALFVPKKEFTDEQINQIRELAKRNLGEKAKL